MTSVAPFTLITAFSSSIHGGNPAAVVFHDLDLPSTVFAGIARNLNQPMTAFLSAKPLPIGNNDEKVVAFGVRWFTFSGWESPLCGHAALAAAKAVFERSDLVSAEEEIAVELHTLTRGIVTARKVEGGLVEIQLPAGNVEEVSPDEQIKLLEVFAKAFGRKLGINYIGKGGIGFEHYLLVELDEDEDLEASHVNAAALHESGFILNIFTAASSGSELFVSRVFPPGEVPGGEDHVCGSAHSLMVPYWYKKRGILRGQETRAKQVSRRGGELVLVWEADKNIVRLTGASRMLGKGELYLDLLPA